MDLCGKVTSLLFNMLSRLVIAFLPRSKSLLNSWLQSPSAVILEVPKIKPATVSTVSPNICHEAMRLDAMMAGSIEFHNIGCCGGFKTSLKIQSYLGEIG